MAAGFARGCKTALNICCNICLAIAGIALVAMTVVVAWSVFGRFVLNDTPAWADVTSMLLMGWVILGAAAAGVREGFHMGFDTLKNVLPAPLTRLFDLLSDTVVMLFGAGMAWFGLELAEGVWNATLPAVGLPGAVEYLPLIAGGFMITLFALERMAAHFAGAVVPSEEIPAATLVSDG